MQQYMNLETICAKCGFAIAQAGSFKAADKETMINKCLGVLAENGFYALNIYLLSCNAVKYGELISEILLTMLSEDLSLFKRSGKGLDAMADVRAITQDLPRLLLARRVTEQALTFARYHCKALGKCSDRKVDRS